MNAKLRDRCDGRHYTVLTELFTALYISIEAGVGDNDNDDDDRLRAIAKDEWETRNTRELELDEHTTANRHTNRTNLCTLIVDFFERMLNKRLIQICSTSQPLVDLLWRVVSESVVRKSDEHAPMDSKRDGAESEIDGSVEWTDGSHQGSIGMVFPKEERILNFRTIAWIIHTDQWTEFHVVNRHGIMMENVLRGKKNVQRLSVMTNKLPIEERNQSNH